MTAEILSRDEVAQLLDCEPETVDIAARKGELPGLKFGRSWIFPHAALLEYLNHRALASMPTKQATKQKPQPMAGVVVASVRKRVIS